MKYLKNKIITKSILALGVLIVALPSIAAAESGHFSFQNYSNQIYLLIITGICLTFGVVSAALFLGNIFGNT